MKRISLILLMSALSLAGGCAAGLSLRPAQEKPLVAVGDIHNQTGNPEYDPLLIGLAENIMEELYETDCCRMLERQKLRSLVEETQSGTTGPADVARALSVGKLAGAEAVLFVNLAAVKYLVKKDSSFFAENVKEEIETSMNARLVAVETSEILAATKIIIPYTNRYRSFCFFKDGEKADQKLIVQQSLEKAGKHLAREIARQVGMRGK